MAKKSIFVISDLHLGGKPGFQMCSPLGQQKLAEFVGWAAKERTDNRDVHLILAGDIVDFLAEEIDGKIAAFTSSDEEAREKLTHIIETNEEVWKAFRGFVAAGGALTLMLGNHDIELCLPATRRFLLDRLGTGRVDFLYDNEAFILDFGQK